MPPHSPYHTHRDFFDRFAKDGWQPIDKPEHLFTRNVAPERLYNARTDYDEFILYVDREFERLYRYLEQSGLLDDTWVVLTSDHGEMFERGIRGHNTKVLNQPIIRIPLLIFEPGRETREDVFTPSSAVDVLPTLMHVIGQEVPEWTEGVVLPPFARTNPDPTRSVYAVQARRTNDNSAIYEATIMLVKGEYKLTYFFGYKDLGEGGELVELYDIENDPEELNNLYPSRKEIGDRLLGEIKEKLTEVNAPYI